MPGMKEYNVTWTLTSTGIGTWQDAAWASEHTFYCDSAAGSTGSVQILTRREGSTITSVLGSSFTMGASSNVVLMITGTLDMVAPRLKTLTSTGTVVVQGIGQS